MPGSEIANAPQIDTFEWVTWSCGLKWKVQENPECLSAPGATSLHRGRVPTSLCVPAEIASPQADTHVWPPPLLHS